MAQIYVEVRPHPATEGDLAPALPELLSKRVDEIGDSLQEIALRLSRRLSEFATDPVKNWQVGEVELKFSMDLETEAGVIIARTSASAGFEVTLTWKKTAPDKNE